MKRIGLISDTHSYLNPKVFKYFEDCDEIWHAGDIGSWEVVDQLKAFKPLRAVYGNIDGGKFRSEFPLDDEFECEGMHVWMTHIAGYPGKYKKRIRELLPTKNIDLFICGHSHILKVMPDKINKHIHINPGAAGIYGFHKVKTLIRFSIDQGKLFDLEVIEIGDNES